MGTCKLKDVQGQDLNLDGTPKIPYQHPNAGQVTTVVHDPVLRQPVVTKLQGAFVNNSPQLEANGEGNMMNSRQSAPTQQQLDMRQGTQAVKPARMDIHEFSGEDVDGWIQTIEMYFDSARTSLNQRTEIVVTYLNRDGAA
jgi:hypothetical protein